MKDDEGTATVIVRIVYPAWITPDALVKCVNNFCFTFFRGMAIWENRDAK